MSTSPGRPARLNATDEMLAVAENSVGASRRIQIVWALPHRPDPARLHEFWKRLDAGVLSRQPRSPVLPGARRWWSATGNEQQPCLGADPLRDNQILEWLDRQVTAPLDGRRLWALSYCPTETGSVVCLTVPHSTIDGIGLLRAIDATTRRPDAPLPDHPSGIDDLRDIADQLITGTPDTARWLGKVGRDARLRASIRDAVRSMAKSRDRSGDSSAGEEPQFFSTAFVTVPAAAWEAAADAVGGTTNSLFLSVAERLCRTAIEETRGRPLEIGIPISLRGEDDDSSANALVVVPLRIDENAPAPHRVRALTKDRLARVCPEDTTLIPQALWHHLPHALSRALKTPGAQFTDAVASNFGETPGRVPDAIDHRPASKVFVRTMSVPGVVPGRARLRLSLCMIRVRTELSLSITGIPGHFGAPGRLADTVESVLHSLRIPAEKWTVS
ncbi:hypothetical protein [Nocardia alni]|uniref:hypothetical protein n=1 Tax=Nocardia alni TaxID=2815723 RepID=UPI001C2512C7|nr:hypothetical protein [Nocardia alni]